VVEWSTLNWQESLKSLLNGDYDGHWPSHENIRTGRSDTKDEIVATPTYGKPVWEGEIEPIVLLVNADFGMGDTIMFYRFIKEAKSRVSRLILRCDEDFKPLFADTQCVGKEEPLPQFDKIIHMMALPGVLGVKKNEISGRPYLSPHGEIDFCLRGLDAIHFTRIGYCWRGNPFNPRDHFRSIPFELSKSVWFADGFCWRFLSLDKIEKPPSEWFYDVRAFMGDWNQTAYLLQSLNLVISVDTAVAHLAGALGVPVWLLVPDEDPDWRWGLDGDRTLWYDSMKLYRRQGNWEIPLKQISEDLTLG
jgi:hypothetical protein